MELVEAEVSGRLNVSGAIGEKLDDALEAASHKVQQRLGGRDALRACQKNIEALLAHVDNDREGEDPKFPSMDELSVLTYVKKYLIRAANVAETMADKADLDSRIEMGKEAAYRASVEMVQKHHNAAATRAKQLMQAREEAAAEAAAERSKKKSKKSGAVGVDENGRNTARRPGERPVRKRPTKKKATKKKA